MPDAVAEHGPTWGGLLITPVVQDGGSGIAATDQRQRLSSADRLTFRAEQPFDAAGANALHY